MPTVVLYKSHLKDVLEDKIRYLIGKNASDAPVGSTMKRMKLTILTPQILIDELNRKKSFVKFTDFSLMIFDECHNTHKKHPYKVIMDRLLDAQVESKQQFPIQIVGMTASPGVGKGKGREQVLENLVTLLASLNVKQCPSVVVHNAEELKKHQNEIAECTIRVEIEPDTFSLKILKAIDLIEKKIESLGMFGPQRHQVLDPPKNKSKQIYEHWVVNLINHVKLKIHDDGMHPRKVVTYAEHLKMYYTLLYLKKHIPNAMDVSNGLASFDQISEEGRFLRKLNSELEKASKNSKVPMLEKLIEELKKQFAENHDSRCIIFVPRKLIATALVTCIANDLSLGYLKPEYLTGANEHEALGGMTKTKQEASLEAFRTGSSKVLIATSVAEEGLDIRACNLVIAYNYVTGEVGKIQRAGRGRAENSRSVLIAPYGSAQIDRDKMNADCALATEFAINDLKELPDEDRLKRIRGIQKRQAIERERDREEMEQQLQEAAQWRILCGKCQAFITRADQLRQIKKQHKFVIDPDFYNRVNKKPFHGEHREISPGIFGVGKFTCNDPKCRHYLGLEMQYKKKFYPTLKVKQLIFENKLGDRRTKQQWNLFAIEDMEEDEVEDEMQDDEEEDKESSMGGLKGPNLTLSQTEFLNDECEAEDMTVDDMSEFLMLGD